MDVVTLGLRIRHWRIAEPRRQRRIGDDDSEATSKCVSRRKKRNGARKGGPKEDDVSTIWRMKKNKKMTVFQDPICDNRKDTRKGQKKETKKEKRKKKRKSWSTGCQSMSRLSEEGKKGETQADRGGHGACFKQGPEMRQRHREKQRDRTKRERRGRQDGSQSR